MSNILTANVGASDSCLLRRAARLHSLGRQSLVIERFAPGRLRPAKLRDALLFMPVLFGGSLVGTGMDSRRRHGTARTDVATGINKIERSGPRRTRV
jgi:hypothetical protein